MFFYEQRSWYNSKRGVVRMKKRKDSEESLERKTSWENLFTFPSRKQQIMQTNGGSFSNSFSTSIGQQIQLIRDSSNSQK